MKYVYNFLLTCAFLQPSQAITLEVMKSSLRSENNWATPQLVMLNNKGLSMLLAILSNKYTHYRCFMVSFTLAPKLQTSFDPPLPRNSLIQLTFSGPALLHCDIMAPYLV